MMNVRRVTRGAAQLYRNLVTRVAQCATAGCRSARADTREALLAIRQLSMPRDRERPGKPGPSLDGTFACLAVSSAFDSLCSLGTPLDSTLRWPATSEARKGRVVRKRGFEPLRSCDRQPLKLVRLPVPPLPRRGLLRCSSHLGWCVCYFHAKFSCNWPFRVDNS